MKRAFTLLELIMAVTLTGVMTAVSIATFRAVTNGWRVSREYADRMERTDFAIDQLMSALKCAYYPHNGSQDDNYGFVLTDNGDGDSIRDSDVIEWTKLGSALIGTEATGDTVHRIQLRVLEEGDGDWGEKIERTGLYARIRPLAKVIPESSSTKDEDEYTFNNEELYRPMLIAADVDGFNCRVMTEPPADDNDGKQDKDAWEDEFSKSNSLPYKVQLTLYIDKEEDQEYRSRRKRVPLLRTIRMPAYEQSQDGAGLPGEETKGAKGKEGTAK